MIGDATRASLDRMVAASLRSAFPAAGGVPVVVEPCEPPAAVAGTHLVVLMIAAHGFRLVLTLAFAMDLPTRAWLAAAGRIAAGDPSPQAVRDAMSESGNMACGALNREIGRFYRHTGMSTPHIIDSRSAPHIAALPHQHLRHFRLAVDGAVLFHATLCAHAHEAMDIDWQPEAEDQAETTGELEFF